MIMRDKFDFVVFGFVACSFRSSLYARRVNRTLEKYREMVEMVD